MDPYVTACSTLTMFLLFFQLKIVAACNFDGYTIFSSTSLEYAITYALVFSVVSLCYLKLNSILKGLRWCFFDVKQENIWLLIGSSCAAILLAFMSTNFSPTVADCAPSLNAKGKVIAILQGHQTDRPNVPQFDIFCNVNLLREKGISSDQLSIAHSKNFHSGMFEIWFQDNLVPYPNYVKLENNYPEVSFPLLTDVFVGEETNIVSSDIITRHNTDDVFQYLQQKGFTRMPSKCVSWTNDYYRYSRPVADATVQSISDGRANPWVVSNVSEHWWEPKHWGFVDNRRPVINIKIQVHDLGADLKPVVRNLSAEAVFCNNNPVCESKILTHLNNLHIGPVYGNDSEESADAEFAIPTRSSDIGDFMGINIGKITDNGTISAPHCKFINNIWVHYNEADLNLDSRKIHISIIKKKNLTENLLTQSVPVFFEQISRQEQALFPICFEGISEAGEKERAAFPVQIENFFGDNDNSVLITGWNFEGNENEVVAVRQQTPRCGSKTIVATLKT